MSNIHGLDTTPRSFEESLYPIFRLEEKDNYSLPTHRNVIWNFLQIYVCFLISEDVWVYDLLKRATFIQSEEKKRMYTPVNMIVDGKHLEIYRTR